MIDLTEDSDDDGDDSPSQVLYAVGSFSYFAACFEITVRYRVLFEGYVGEKKSRCEYLQCR